MIFHMNQLPPLANLLIVLLAIWTIPWKIYALWLAAKHNHKKWFVALVILNTVSILEIVFVRKVIKKSWADVKEDFREAWQSFK